MDESLGSDSWVSGVNRVSGFSLLQATECSSAVKAKCSRLPRSGIAFKTAR